MNIADIPQSARRLRQKASGVWRRLVLPAWLLLSLLVIAGVILSPAALLRHAPGVRLGTDVPMQMLVDRAGTLTAGQVAAMPDSAFIRLASPLSEGYSRSVYWLRVAPPRLPAGPYPSGQDALWLLVLPSYLDRVTLYQRQGRAWQEYSGGDRVATSSPQRVRQLTFPLREGAPFILRVQTSSPVQLDATIQRSSGLLQQFSVVEWAAGVHQGINLLLVLLITGAALVLRMSSLVALAVGAMATLLHGGADRGYLHIWLPDACAHWADLGVKLGTLMLAAPLAWQSRELLTRHTRWRRIDRMLLLLGIAPLLCLPSIPLDRYEDWAWVGVCAPWGISVLFSVVAWNNLWREGVTAFNVLMALPTTLYVLLGVYVVAAYLGWVGLPAIETGVLWQLNTLLANLVVTTAVGAGLFRQYRAATERQQQLVDSLEASEQALEERVRQRTAELLQTRNALQAALHSERTIREEQRQFFNMINHEFRTPLTVIDTAATEQQTFPSLDADSLSKQAAQIRRACRRLMTLVDTSLVNDRLDAVAFELRLDRVSLRAMAEEAGELVHWSNRHHLRLDMAHAPDEWECDPTLVRIALSNLVDNAVKYARAGEIAIAARLDASGTLHLSVSDDGPGLTPDAAARIFERYERGDRTDQTRGFGLGLWVARRIARLHGGDIRVSASERGGSCFVFWLAKKPLVAGGR